MYPTTLATALFTLLPLSLAANIPITVGGRRPQIQPLRRPSQRRRHPHLQLLPPKPLRRAKQLRKPMPPSRERRILFRLPTLKRRTRARGIRSTGQRHGADLDLLFPDERKPLSERDGHGGERAVSSALPLPLAGQVERMRSDVKNQGPRFPEHTLSVPTRSRQDRKQYVPTSYLRRRLRLAQLDVYLWSKLNCVSRWFRQFAIIYRLIGNGSSSGTGSSGSGAGSGSGTGLGLGLGLDLDLDLDLDLARVQAAPPVAPVRRAPL